MTSPAREAVLVALSDPAAFILSPAPREETRTHPLYRHSLLFEEGAVLTLCAIPASLCYNITYCWICSDQFSALRSLFTSPHFSSPRIDAWL